MNSSSEDEGSGEENILISTLHNRLEPQCFARPHPKVTSMQPEQVQSSKPVQYSVKEASDEDEEFMNVDENCVEEHRES